MNLKKLLCLMLVLCALLPAALAETNITALGSATIHAEPNIAIISFGVEARGESVTMAQEQVNGIVAGATDALLSLGIAGEDLVTDYYNFNPEYDYSGELPQQIGYRAFHNLSVTVRDLARVNDVLAALSSTGVTQVGNVQFDLADRHTVYLAALEQAVKAAREKGEVLAAASGLTIMQVEDILERDTGDTQIVSDARNMMKESAGAGLRADNVSVSASVTVKFEAR